MKVIKASVDLKAWRIEKTCSGCQSVLEIDAKDISYDYDYGKSPWRVTCCLCKTNFTLPEKEIPKIVQIDATTHRYISHPCSD